VSMLATYPVLARTPCSTCKKYVLKYDWSTHQGTGAIEIDEATDEPMERDGPPPCQDGRRSSSVCPKVSPEKEAEYSLSDKNRQTYQVYQEVRATAGGCLTEAMKADRLLMRNLAAIDEIVRRGERRELAENLAALFPRA
jgi:hypothetical protein